MLVIDSAFSQLVCLVHATWPIGCYQQQQQQQRRH